MLKLVILFAGLACALGAAVPEGMLPQLDGRIVGGTKTTIGHFPYQISLQRSGGHSCGGSIYSHNIIVTAAHCLQKDVSPSILRIRAGSSYWASGGTVIKVAAYKNHEGYNARTMINDIAVIRLESSLSYSANIRPIELSSRTPGDGTHAIVSGWGTTSSGGSGPMQLQYVDVEIVDRSKCASSAFSYGKKIKATMICAYAVDADACQGDSGGPLVADSELVGVVSWGVGCADAKYPGVYADVADFKSWVEETSKHV